MLTAMLDIEFFLAGGASLDCANQAQHQYSRPHSGHRLSLYHYERRQQGIKAGSRFEDTFPWKTLIALAYAKNPLHVASQDLFSQAHGILLAPPPVNDKAFGQDLGQDSLVHVEFR